MSIRPEAVAYLHNNKENPDLRGVSLYHDTSCTSSMIITEPLIRLSDYEALQAECNQLRRDAERCRWLRNGNDGKEVRGYVPITNGSNPIPPSDE